MNARLLRSAATGGAVTPWVSERFDTERHPQTCNALVNAIPLPQGPVVKRPGFVEHSTPATTGEHRIIPFYPSGETPVLLTMTNGELTHPGGTVAAPWAWTGDVVPPLWEIQATQVGDSVIFTHSSFAPQWMRLLDGTYYFSAMPWDWPALRDENTSELEVRLNTAGAMGELGAGFQDTAYDPSHTGVGYLRTEGGKVYARVLDGAVGTVATQPEAWRLADWLEARAPLWAEGRRYRRGDVIMVPGTEVSTVFHKALEDHEAGTSNYPPGAVTSWGVDALTVWEPIPIVGYVGTPAEWAANTTYAPGDLVGNLSGASVWHNVWRCTVAHAATLRNAPPLIAKNTNGVAALFYPGWSAPSGAGPLTFTGSPDNRILSTFKQDWGTGGPGGTIPPTYFGARFITQILPPATGNYRLRLTTYDGQFLTVDGVAISGSTSPTGAPITTTSGTLAWTINTPVLVQVDFTQHIAGSSIRLEWEQPAGSFEDIPAENLWINYVPGVSYSPGSGADYALYWRTITPFPLLPDAQDYYALYHTRNDQSVKVDVSGNTVSDTLRVIGGWVITTTGTWSGTIRLDRQQRSGSWETVRTWTRALGEQNITLDGREEPESNMRLVVEGGAYTGSTAATVRLEAVDARIPGLVRIWYPARRVASVTVIQAPLSDDWTSYHAEGAYSPARGYPASCCIHGQRLIFGGGKSEPLTFRGSVIGDLFNFTAGVSDDSSFSFTLAGTQVAPILWMHSGQRLFLGTSLGEWSLNGGGGGPETVGITPTNVDAVQQSEYGSAYRQPVAGGDTLLFLQRGRVEIRELQWAGADAQSTAPRLTVLGGHLTRGKIQQWAQSMHPLPLVWAVTDDGQLLSFTFEKDQNVVAWARHTTPGGLFESLAVVRMETRDELYVVVNRDGTRTVERLHWESFEAIQPATDFPFTSSGVPDGMVWEDVGGAYTCQVIPQRMELATQQGTSQGKEWRAVEVALRLWRTAGTVTVQHLGSQNGESKALGVLTAGTGARVPADDVSEASPLVPAWENLDTSPGGIIIDGEIPEAQLFTGEVVFSLESRPSRFLDLSISHSDNTPFVLLSWNPNLKISG